MELHSPLEAFNQFKKFSQAFYPESINNIAEPIENHPTIQTFKKRIEGNKHEKCFFIVNMINGRNREPEISFSCNAKQLFNTSHFELIDYFRMLPPLHLKALFESSVTIFEQLKGYKHEFSIENHYQVHTPLKIFVDNKPRYVLAKRKLFPFLYSDDNTLYGYINEVSIENRFLTEDEFLKYPLEPMILFDINNIEKTFTDIIRQNLKIENFLPFKDRRLEVLKAYCKNENLESKELALELGISQDTLNTHHRDILRISREELGLFFSNIRLCARYFAKWWLV